LLGAATVAVSGLCRDRVRESYQIVAMNVRCIVIAENGSTHRALDGGDHMIRVASLTSVAALVSCTTLVSPR
jgi:hypothetical protein